MSFAPHFHMPGNYHFEAPTSLNAGIFRPPISPSASSYNLAKSTGSLISDVSTNNTPAPLLRRKRTHDDRERESHVWASDLQDPGSPLLGPTSGPRYVLAGQIETPGAHTVVENGGLDDSMYSDVDYRRALGPTREDHGLESPSVRLANLQIGSEPAPRSPGWSAFALNTIGGVVGKVWEFCRGGAFTGFYAGGGKGYDLQAGGSPPSKQDEKTWSNANDVPTPLIRTSPRRLMSPPGAFPEMDYISYQETSVPDIPSRPAAKRRQLSEQDELRRNWVMVDEPASQPRSKAKRAPPGTAASPAPSRASTRPQPPRYSMPTSASGRRISVPVSRLNVAEQRPGLTRRASTRVSHAGSPSLSSREPASFAQPRSPRPSTPSSSANTRIPQPANQTPNPFAALRAASPRPSSRPSSRRSSITSPTNPTFPTLAKGGSGSHRRNASTASAASTARRKTGLVADDIEASPRLDAEAKHLAAKKLVAEKQADARIEAFNTRLMDMIRQGKEALGTTVEVDMDEGWDDDED